MATKVVDLGKVVGADGKSAYQSAVDGGYTGTEAELNAALAAAPGHVAAKDNPHGVTAAQAGARPADWTPTAADVGADREGAAAAVQASLNSHTAGRANPHGVTAAQAGAVPTGRKVNGKALTGDISLSAADVGAAASGHTHTAAQVGADASGTAAGVQNNLNAHTGNRSNPHGVYPAQIGAAPAYTYGTGDLAAGSSPLATGTLYFMYE